MERFIIETVANKGEKFSTDSTHDCMIRADRRMEEIIGSVAGLRILHRVDGRLVQSYELKSAA